MPGCEAAEANHSSLGYLVARDRDRDGAAPCNGNVIRNNSRISLPLSMELRARYARREHSVLHRGHPDVRS
jgi:hypothetical protein